MLEEIAIRDLGVIDAAVLELSPGLTVLTGETGAGKTMVMTGLGLLLGGRAEAALIRGGAAKLVVEGRVRVAPGSPVALRAAEAGGDLDDGVLILSRTVTAEGRSRAHVGGRSAPASVLAELGEDLVAVHGQHDQQRFLRPGRRREALDRFAGDAVAVPLAAYRETYDRLQGRPLGAGRAHRPGPRARPGGRRAAPGRDRDRGRGAAARRGREAHRRSRPPRPRGRAARGRDGRARPAPVRPDQRGRRRRRGEPGRRRPAGARGEGRARPGARRADRPGRRGLLPARGRDRRPRVVRVRHRRRPRASRASPGPSGGAGRADPQVRRHGRRRPRVGVRRVRPAARAGPRRGHDRGTARRVRAAARRPRDAGGQGVEGPHRRRRTVLCRRDRGAGRARDGDRPP